jgi:hypothetical protein
MTQRMSEEEIAEMLIDPELVDLLRTLQDGTYEARGGMVIATEDVKRLVEEAMAATRMRSEMDALVSTANQFLDSLSEVQTGNEFLDDMMRGPELTSDQKIKRNLLVKALNEVLAVPRKDIDVDEVATI